MLIAREKSNENVNIFNIGNEDWITVHEIAEIVCNIMNLRPEFKFTGGDRGWRGDVPLMLLDITRIKNLGFVPKYSSREAVEKTVKSLISL
jgi:UDP-glucose 4-epimerase